MEVYSGGTAARQVMVGAVLLLAASGCMTLRDLREDVSQLSSRQKKSEPWQDKEIEDFDMMGERRPSRITARDFQPRYFMSTMRIMTALKDDQAAAQELFAQGHEHYQEAAALHGGDRPDQAVAVFQRAANSFREAAASWPDSALEEDALFMQGESLFFADEYVMANRAYETLIAKFSGTNYLDQVEARRFAIAQYWLQVADVRPATRWLNVASKMLPTTSLAGEARRILHRIRLDDPTGKLADDATMALGNAHFRAGNYQDAADAFDDLRKSYPGSPHQFNAHLFELKALMETYAGPDYDGEPLEKADQLMKAMVRLFPNEVKEQEEYLAAEGTRIRNMLADRDYQVGEYYEARGENRAAGIYYSSAASYQETEPAKQAAERIAVVADKEPEPVRQMGWFIDMFPEPKATRPLIPSGNQGTIYR
jgi:outer membrane protein assembly factor BamD (BamD/ComL family)